MDSWKDAELFYLVELAAASSFAVGQRREARSARAGDTFHRTEGQEKTVR